MIFYNFCCIEFYQTVQLNWICINSLNENQAIEWVGFIQLFQVLFDFSLKCMWKKSRNVDRNKSSFVHNSHIASWHTKITPFSSKVENQYYFWRCDMFIMCSILPTGYRLIQFASHDNNSAKHNCCLHSIRKTVCGYYIPLIS